MLPTFPVLKSVLKNYFVEFQLFKFMKKLSIIVQGKEKFCLKKTILIMKLSILLLLMNLVQISASVYSQNERFTFKSDRIQIRELLDKIESESNYKFLYRSDNVNTTFVRLNATNVSLEDLLSAAFSKTEMTYKVLEDKLVVIAPKNFTSSLQPQRVSGTITDGSTGETLAGVSVGIEGTTIGVISDLKGEYTIDIPDNKVDNAVLFFSYVGYLPEKVNWSKQSTVDVKLSPDIQRLNEVVVMGYTTQSRATVTGSIATMTTEDLKQSPTANLTNALAGRLPGMMVNQFSGGEPGVDASDVYIRGFGTYNDKSPIVIVDGVERSMNYLAAEEIESFTILKDASATAPYGVRGANGVIVITTKRGKVQDKASVSFKAAVGVNKPAKFPKYLGSADYAELYNEAVVNDNPGVDKSTLNLFSDDAIAKFRKAKGDNSDGLGYDWDYFDYAFKPGLQQDYSLSIRGGSQRARYYVMANYFAQDGNYTHTDLHDYSTQAVFKRYNFRSNIDIDITNSFYARLDLGARITDRNAPGTTANRVVEFCNTQPSYLPIIVEKNDNPDNAAYLASNPDGMLYGDQLHRFNILGELSRTGYLNEKNTYMDGSFSLGHKLDFITEGLKFDVTFSYDASEGRWINRRVDSYTEGYREYPSYATFVPEDGSDVYMSPGHYTGAYVTGNKYDVDQTIGNSFTHNDAVSRAYYQLKLSYDRNFGAHAISAMILGNRSKKTINENVPYCYQGLTGRVTYDFRKKYLLDADFGYNGSENFAKGKRYGFFPAISAGWIISNEDFMSDTKLWLDNLKITNKDLMNDYIQRERRVELFYENNRIWSCRLYLQPSNAVELAKEQAWSAAGADNDSRSQNYWPYPKCQRMINGMKPVEDPVGKIIISGVHYKMKRFYVENRVFVTPRHYLFPILQSEISRSSTLVQNPGW
jgi:TonB-dependent SusC/RagA subfamily outer membrane receptor